MGFLDMKKTNIIYMAYILVLLIFSGIFFMIPADNFITQHGDGSHLAAESAKARKYLYETAERGFFSVIDGIITLGSWSFEYSGDLLEISASDNLDMIIIAKYKDVDDNTIDIHQYSTKTIVEHIDMTDKISEPVEIDLQSEGLVITSPGTQVISLKTLNRNFTQKQFNKEGKSDESGKFRSIIIGASLIYMEIPKGLELKGKNIPLKISHRDSPPDLFKV